MTIDQSAKWEGRLELCPSDVASELAGLLTERSAPKFSHYLTSRRILEAMNSAYRDGARTRRKYPVNWAYLNPEDMAEKGVQGSICSSVAERSIMP